MTNKIRNYKKTFISDLRCDGWTDVSEIVLPFSTTSRLVSIVVDVHLTLDVLAIFILRYCLVH